MIISDVLAGCKGVANIADDLVVYGADLSEHDANLHKVLTRLREKGLTVNGDKCQFRLPKLTFFGHKLSAQGVAPSEEKTQDHRRMFRKLGHSYNWYNTRRSLFQTLHRSQSRCVECLERGSHLFGSRNSRKHLTN